MIHQKRVKQATKKILPFLIFKIQEERRKQEDFQRWKERKMLEAMLMKTFPRPQGHQKAKIPIAFKQRLEKAA